MAKYRAVIMSQFAMTAYRYLYTASDYSKARVLADAKRMCAELGFAEFDRIEVETMSGPMSTTTYELRHHKTGQPVHSRYRTLNPGTGNYVTWKLLD